MGWINKSKNKSVEILLKQAVSAHHQMNYLEAKNLYNKVLEIDANHLDANYLLGTLHAQFDNLPEAEFYLSKAAKINPDSPMVQTNLGNVYKHQKKYDLARSCFNRAIQLKEDLAPAHFGLGTVLEETGERYENIIACYNRALSLGPDIPEIHQQIGKLLLSVGDIKALDFYATAMRLNPDLKGIHKDIGFACLRFDRKGEAQVHLRTASQNDPNDPEVQYFLAISDGRQPDKDIQEKYVQKEFNNFAGSFEKTLLERLEYGIPAQVKGLVEELSGAETRFDSVADLGCGTGLTGELFRSSADKLVGIDISDKMIELANKKDCYDELILGEIVDVLNTTDQMFDLLIATDVIMYIGDLNNLFKSILNRSKSGALLVLSTERHGGDGFVLQITGRYAHSPDYIRSLSDRYGCTIIREKQVPIRKEWRDWIMGDIFAIRLP